MRPLRLLTVAAIALAFGQAGFCAETSFEVREVHTSTRCVTSIALAQDGSLWAATRGGVLWRNPSGQWRKFTTFDGLPSNESLAISTDGEAVTATFPQSTATWNGTTWEPRPGEKPKTPQSLCSCMWRGKSCRATAEGLWSGERLIGMPPSNGSHISALLPRDDKLWAAVFGDGLWEFDGEDWSKVDIALPPSARDITALAAAGSTIWVGTRTEWVWEYNGATWAKHAQPNEPHAANCQAMVSHVGKLYVSTLEDGLVAKGADGWDCVRTPILSSNAPRQMVVLGHTLYVRHGSGKVDSLDAGVWRRDVCGALPRKQSSCITADAQRLYVGQWGGWSEFDGRTWVHYLQIPELQGVQVTAILPESDRMWIGTQGRGIAEVQRVTSKVKWHDERHGLPDDWVKCIARVDDTVRAGTLYAGTFVGGLAYHDNSGWVACPGLRGAEITALLPDGNGGLIAAARTGVYRVRAGALIPISTQQAPPLLEAQAICAVNGILWIGTRTGILELRAIR